MANYQPDCIASSLGWYLNWHYFIYFQGNWRNSSIDSCRCAGLCSVYTGRTPGSIYNLTNTNFQLDIPTATGIHYQCSCRNYSIVSIYFPVKWYCHSIEKQVV